MNHGLTLTSNCFHRLVKSYYLLLDYFNPLVPGGNKKVTHT